MHETGVKLLKLMFREGETVCVSPNQYGYHSIPLENVFSGHVTLVLEDPKYPNQTCPSDELRLIALNPIKGFRNDKNCIAFRNFLVEMDIGPLKQQLEYIEKIGMPYSAAIFSGGKSLHFLISLDIDLPSEKTWRNIAEWVLNIATAADKLTKNPSRCIRIPGPKRDNSRQVLARYNGAVKFSELKEWLEKHPDQKPKHKEKRMPSGNCSYERIAAWAKKALREGLDPTKGRNIQWFAISCEFALAGYSEDDIIELLSKHFEEENDFKEREWLASVRSGVRHIQERKND